jgi:hypothetical protein
MPVLSALPWSLLDPSKDVRPCFAAARRSKGSNLWCWVRTDYYSATTTLEMLWAVWHRTQQHLLQAGQGAGEISLVGGVWSCCCEKVRVIKIGAVPNRTFRVTVWQDAIEGLKLRPTNYRSESRYVIEVSNLSLTVTKPQDLLCRWDFRLRMVSI